MVGVRGTRVGRSVGGIGVLVGTGVRVPKTSVGSLVGGRVPIRVGVRVGTRVRVGKRGGVLVFVSEVCSSVALARNNVRVLAGVMVLLGVNVGVAEISGVAVGVLEGVLLGMVDVGKGPSSACMVPAMAVLILSTC